MRFLAKFVATGSLACTITAPLAAQATSAFVGRGPTLENAYCWTSASTYSSCQTETNSGSASVSSAVVGAGATVTSNLVYSGASSENLQTSAWAQFNQTYYFNGILHPDDQLRFMFLITTNYGYERQTGTGQGLYSLSITGNQGFQTAKGLTFNQDGSAQALSTGTTSEVGNFWYMSSDLATSYSNAYLSAEFNAYANLSMTGETGAEDAGYSYLNLQLLSVDVFGPNSYRGHGDPYAAAGPIQIDLLEEPTTTPEPATLLLMAPALIGVGSVRRRARNSARGPSASARVSHS